MKVSFTIVALIAALGFFAGCSQNNEADDLSKAQDCLNKVPESDPSQASSCMAFVSEYDSQQADILKCAIEITEGGLTEDKMVSAYNAVQDSSSSSKDATYMAYLILDNAATDGYTHAVNAYQYCSQSGVTGLIYISGLILEGTTVAKAAGGSTDASNISNTISTMVTDCQGGAGNGTCPTTDELSQMADTAVTVADSYCASSSADQSVCSDITNAVNDAGGDSTALVNNLLCLMNGQTYSGGSCI